MCIDSNSSNPRQTTWRMGGEERINRPLLCDLERKEKIYIYIYMFVERIKLWWGIGLFEIIIWYYYFILENYSIRLINNPDNFRRKITEIADISLTPAESESNLLLISTLILFNYSPSPPFLIFDKIILFRFVRPGIHRIDM